MSENQKKIWISMDNTLCNDVSSGLESMDKIFRYKSFKNLLYTFIF